MATIADLTNELFRNHRRPDGREYTNRDVSRALNGELEPSYLGKIRSGKIKNPSRNTLLLLCHFFNSIGGRVEPNYFFPELTRNDLSGDELDELSDSEINDLLAKQAAALDYTARKRLIALLEALNHQIPDCITNVRYCQCQTEMKTTAELVDNLFRTYRKRNGREYSYAEIVETLNGAIDPSQISKVRYGQIKNPGRGTLLALCRFFQVPASYFFPELEDSQPETPPPPPDDPISAAVRATKLSPEIRKNLDALIRVMEKNL